MTLSPNKTSTHLSDIILETAPVAMIRKDVAAISKHNNLEFEESYDDLDFLVFATLTLHLKSRVGLIYRKHSPVPGIEICVRHDQQNVERLISETLYELDLTPNDLAWLHPEYEKPFSELLREQSEHKKSLCTRIACTDLSKFNLSTDLSGSNLSGLHLKGVQLRKSNLSKTKLTNTELGFACLREANLESADLQGADLRLATLQKASLQYANLGGSYLQEADLQGANLQHANLKGADLRGANLQHANLKGADLRGANLQRASLKSSNLSFAQLDDATFLKDADIGDAKLKSIHWDKDTMWFNIIGLHKATGIPSALKKHLNFQFGIKLSEAIEELSENNNLNKFRKIYKQVLAEIKSPEIIASLWNKIAWLSCLYGYPDNECYEAAINAVQLANTKGNYHDTLGLVFALRGDYESSIKEFEIALESEDVQDWIKDFRDKRRAWIKDLRLGQNPFNEDVIKDLKIEER
jgi:uncharacterized protein YjbI with pentapeptide repeats